LGEVVDIVDIVSVITADVSEDVSLKVADKAKEVGREVILREQDRIQVNSTGNYQDRVAKRLRAQVRDGDFEGVTIADFVILMNNSTLPKPKATCVTIPDCNVDIASVQSLGKVTMFASLLMFIAGGNICALQGRRCGRRLDTAKISLELSARELAVG